jgi:glycosyltransferase involved in cell wall biosynthesis
MRNKVRKLLGFSKEAIRPYYLRWLYFPLFPSRQPRHFTDCWRYPPYQMDSQLAANPQGPDLLFLPMTDWHTRIQRTQHLAKTFASLGQRCFYLNPHLGREFPYPYVFTQTPKITAIEPFISELHIHLPFEPVFHDRLLSAQENATVVHTLKTVFQNCGSSRLIQMVSFPLWLDIARELRSQFGFPIVYDCHDVLSGFRNIAPEIVTLERNLFESSDLVVFSSRELLVENTALYPELKTKSILVRNAVDESWLTVSDLSRGDTASNTSEEIIIGYVGALDFWFDVDAIQRAAVLHPEWHIVLVGRVEDKRILQLRSLSNVSFAGEVPHMDLHPYMAKFRVALIPFLRNKLTMGTNPIKLYEYFSYGLPVVSTRLPEMEEFGSLVYLAEGPDDFTRQLETAVRENDPSLKEKRIRLAHQENWSARVAQLSEAFAHLTVSA